MKVNFGSGHYRENGKRISISVNSTKLQKRFQLKLKPNEHIIDPHFIALMRKSNHSLVITDNVPEFDCYYQSEGENFAALDLCEGVLVNTIHDTYFLFQLTYKLLSIRKSSVTSA